MAAQSLGDWDKKQRAFVQALVCTNLVQAKVLNPDYALICPYDDLATHLGVYLRGVL